MESGSLTESLRETLVLFDEAGEPRTTPEVAESLDLGRRSTYARLKRLVEQDRLETKKVGANARVWWRSPTNASIAPANWPAASESLVDDLLVDVTASMYALDIDGYVRTWNRSAEVLTGYDATEIRGEHVRKLYTDEDRKAGVPEGDLEAAAEDGSIRNAGWRVRKDGSRFWATDSVRAIRDDDGNLQGYAKITHDTTGLKHAEEERELLYETTRAIAEATTVDEGLEATLRAVGEMTEWEYAEAWLRSCDGGLRRSDADYFGERFERFATSSVDTSFAPGEGLPGRVFESGEREWISDVSAAPESTFVRTHTADSVGLRAALGVPVVADGDVVAVLTFLTSEARDTDERLVETVSSVAAKLGTLIVRRQSEEQSERERTLTDRILDVSPVGLMVLDGDGEYSRINEHAMNIWEISDDRDSYRPADLSIYDADGDSIPPEDRPPMRALRTGDPVLDWRGRLDATDGDPRWLSVSAVPILDADGEVDHVVTTSEDISPFKERTQRLERQRNVLRTELDEVIERISDGFLAVDETWRLTYLNEAAEEQLGRSESEILDEVLWDAFPNLRGTEFENAYREAMETQEPTTVEAYYSPLDSWYRDTVYPSESGLSTHFQDITEQKEREGTLEEAEQRYRTLLEHFPNGAVALIDRDLRHIDVGGRVFENLDFDASDLQGELIQDVYGDDLLDTLEPHYRAALEGEQNSFELEFQGRTFVLWTIPLTTDDGDVFAVMAMAQDITERNQYEKRLQGLYESSREFLTADTPAAISETLTDMATDILDLPGVVVYGYDAERDCLVPEVSSHEVDFMREEFPDVPLDDSSITGHVFCQGDTRYYENVLESPHLQVSPDAIEMRAGLFVPIGTDRILIAGSRDVDGFDANTQRLVEVLATNAEAAYERVAGEQDLAHQHEQLVAMNNLNEVLREVTDAAIDQSTREEIESTVCAYLADSDSYLFAWIGDVDATSQTVNLRTEAGVEGYLDEITISVDADDDRGEGPTGRAFRTGEIQTTQDIDIDSRFDPWRDYVDAYDFRSSAAVPIVYEESVYGVLNVYAERPYAFEGREREIFTRLGEIVGHAIAAAERKRALMSDELVELDFQIQDVFSALEVPFETRGTIALDNAVPIGSDEFLVSGTATPDAIDALSGLVEALPHWKEVTFHSDESTDFELLLSDPPILSLVTSVGGYVERAVIEDGDYRMTFHLAPSVDIHRVIDAVTETYPDAKMIRRQQITRSRDDPQRVHRHLVDDLTGQQRVALEAAYHAGFFEWPRKTSGQGVAELMGVAPPTFHQHLRKAERKVLDWCFRLRYETPDNGWSG